MKVLSLFDGMACGMLAMRAAGIEVEKYVAFEIDKYAIKTASYNFPDIEQRGDVFAADFTEFRGFDWLIGGSPCTYWSIAQKNNRETEASGMGWELFSQYIRALHEAQPMYFIYENNKSMSKAIRQSITEAFGFDPVCINSALVSAQNRQRLYWVGRRNPDGTYSKVDVEQPKDRGILLKDILESGCAWQDKSYCIVASEHKGDSLQRTLTKSVRTKCAEPVVAPFNCTANGKGFCLDANYWKSPGSPETFLEGGHARCNRSMVAEPLNITTDGKARTIRATCYKDGIRNIAGNNIDRKTGVAEPVCVAQRGRYADTGNRNMKEKIGTEQHYEARGDGKTNSLTTVQKDNSVCEPVRVGCFPSPDGTIKNSQGMRLYAVDGKSVNLTALGGGMGGKTGLYAIPCCKMPIREATKKGYTEIAPMDCVDLTQPNSKTRRGRNMSDKSNCCMTSCQYYQFCGCLGYATPCEWDENGRVIKAISVADGKVYPVYEVKDGQITIKGKTYPIKLIDGVYIIRKLTVREGMRLQTIPEWYEFPVSDTQAYKMIGNGWTVDVIVHLIKAALMSSDRVC